METVNSEKPQNQRFNFRAQKKQKHFIYWPHRNKTCLGGFANNKGADQPAHPRSLISAFVIPILESTICKIAAGEISIF